MMLSRAFQRSSKDIFEKLSMEVLKVFQGCFKEVLRVFQGRLRGVPRDLEG